MELAAREGHATGSRTFTSGPWTGRLAWGALALALLLVYSAVFIEWVHDWIRDPNYRHGFLIPLISGFLIWRKRRQLAQARVVPSLFGLLGLLIAAALLILGSAGAEVFTQRVSFVFFLASLVLFLRGWESFRLTFFPFALMLLAIPLPYVIYYGLTSPMQAFAAKCAIHGLKLVGVPVVAQGNMIHLANGSLEVADACSGIRSLYAFLVLGALMAYTMKAPAWVRGLVFLLAIPLSIAGNAVRAFGTGVLVHLAGPKMAEGAIHEFFGMVVIVVCLAVFLLLRKVARSLWSGSSSPS
jgi:exosortase